MCSDAYVLLREAICTIGGGIVYRLYYYSSRKSEAFSVPHYFCSPYCELSNAPHGTLGVGMKVLLLDSVTTQVVAMVYSQSQILEKEVYLVERVDADHEAMQHLKAVYFIRPTRENIQTLCAEIARPRFAEYHVFFCNICPPDLLSQLAAADEHEGGRRRRAL